MAAPDFKTVFREYASVDKSSVHTTDSFEDAKNIITRYISPGMDTVFNNIPRRKTKSYLHFRNEVAMLSDSRVQDRMVFDGGQVLALLGIRDTRDCDYYLLGEHCGESELQLSPFFDRRSDDLSLTLGALKIPEINFPIFQFDGVNYLRPEIVLELKKHRLQKTGDTKDQSI